MQHVLMQQLKKRAEVLAVLKQRILTTNSCSVTQTKKEQCTFRGVLGLADMLGSSVKVGGLECAFLENVTSHTYYVAKLIWADNHLLINQYLTVPWGGPNEILRLHLCLVKSDLKYFC